MSAFTILQVPGSVKRSHPVDGVAESLIKSKKYLIPLVVLRPEVAGSMVVGTSRRAGLRLPKDATIFEVGDPAPGAVSQAAPGAALPEKQLQVRLLRLGCGLAPRQHALHASHEGWLGSWRGGWSFGWSRR
jgi:hypothetical protein